MDRFARAERGGIYTSWNHVSGSDPDHYSIFDVSKEFGVDPCMGHRFHNASLMCNLPQRRLLKLGLLSPKPFNRSWILVACGSVSEDLVATATSEPKKGLAGRKVRDPPS